MQRVASCPMPAAVGIKRLLALLTGSIHKKLYIKEIKEGKSDLSFFFCIHARHEIIMFRFSLKSRQ